jgi:hypothetical protein
MKARTITLILVTCFVGLTLSFGQGPSMGTWKLMKIGQSEDYLKPIRR